MPDALRSTAGFRLAVGLLQGFALYLLYSAYEDRVWPATVGTIFAPLLVVALFVPLLLVQAVGNVRPRTLIIWSTATTLVLAALAAHEIWKSWPEDWVTLDGRAERFIRPPLIPSAPFFFATAVAIFIAHSLATAGDADRRLFARYETYFDTAWKLALQFVLSLAFVGVFWGILFLGANLFELIDIDALSDLIKKSWFAIPATTIATAVALHVTDVRSGIVRGMRTLVHVLLSWLLPLLTFLVAAFLITLVFTGVQPLWDTRFASALLLVSAGALIVLINAAYKDGDPADAPPPAVRYPGSAAALCLLPLAVLSLVAIGLRVQQYGWTADRILATAVASVALIYAIGYAIAAVWRGPWLKRIESWNVGAGFFVVALTLALFSPVLDPARISVGSQIARLESGRVSPEQFDYLYLRWDGGRYGRAALLRLQASARAAGRLTQVTAIDDALRSTSRYQLRREPQPITTAQRADNLAVYPVGQNLPADFLASTWEGARERTTPPCLRLLDRRCDASLVDLNADGVSEIVVSDTRTRTVFARGEGGRWIVVGTLGRPGACPELDEALRRQTFVVVPPNQTWNDVQVGNRRLPVVPAIPFPPAGPC